MSLKTANLPHGTPLCGAKNRQGNACTALGMKNGRCRFHGGKSTGPKTLEGKQRSKRGNWKHGLYSAEAKTERKEAQALLRSVKARLRQD